MALLQQIKLPRRITVNDANPGVLVTQNGAGPGVRFAGQGPDYGDLGSLNGLNNLWDMLGLGKSLYLPTDSGWTPANAGLGEPPVFALSYMQVGVDLGAGGTSLAYVMVLLMAAPNTNLDTFSLGKKFDMYFSVGRGVLDANAVTYVQLKAAAAHGDLAAAGVGLKIYGAATTMYAEAHSGGVRSEQSLGVNLPNYNAYSMRISHRPGVSTRWFVNDLTGTPAYTLLANLPAGNIPGLNVVVSIGGAMAADNTRAYCSPILIVMENGT